MELEVSGVGMDVGTALAEYARARMGVVVGRYFDRPVDGHVVFSRQRHWVRVQCQAHLSLGVTFQSEAEEDEAHASLDVAMTRLEKQLRRYKRRLRDRHNRNRSSRMAVRAQALAGSDASGGDADEEAGEGDEGSEKEQGPLIVAEDAGALATLTVTEAVARLDDSQAAFVIFRNGGHGGVNVVHWREDGHVGWIDPQAEISGAARPPDTRPPPDMRPPDTRPPDSGAS